MKCVLCVYNENHSRNDVFIGSKNFNSTLHFTLKKDFVKGEKKKTQEIFAQ